MSSTAIVSKLLAERLEIQTPHGRQIFGALLFQDLAVVPLLMWPFTFLTAPAALYLALRYWKRPLSVVRRTRWRYIAAIAIALAQIAAWIFGVAFFVSRWKATT